MGKRIQGSAMRQKKRVKVQKDALQEQQAQELATKSVGKQTNEELFVLDTSGAPESKTQRLAKIKAKSKVKGLSEKDSKQVKAIIEKHQGNSETLQHLANRTKERLRTFKRTKRVIGNVRAGFDLWGCGADEPTATTKTTTANNNKNKKRKGSDAARAGIGMSLAGTSPAFATTNAALQRPTKVKPTVAVDVAQGGQSYQPDPQQHQDVINDALAFELRRKEALDYIRAPLSTGFSEETKAILVNDSDDNESSDDDNEDQVVPVRKKEKMTRAQRNRQKRIRLEETVLADQKKAKQLLNSVYELKKYNKELIKLDGINKQKRELLKHRNEENQLKPTGVNVLDKRSRQDPIRVPSLPVALTQDLLGGSLRTLKPKGSLLTDRIDSMVDRKMANRKALGDKKKITHGKKRKVRNKDKNYLLEVL